MERLTKHFTSNVPDEILEALGIADVSKESIELTKCECETCPEVCKRYTCNNCPIDEAFEKLAAYEDAEEQGLLLKLLCKVGSTVWYIDNINEPPTECVITDIHIKGHYILYLAQPKKYSETLGFCKDKLGIDWWLTKEEAEQALAEIQKEV